MVWLDEQRFLGSPRSVRARLVRAQADHHRELVPTVNHWSDRLDAARLRGQADGHRFVWWPSAVEQADDEMVAAIVRGFEHFRPSRHHEVPATVWKAAGLVLPRAEELAGSFAAGSGPNCFGTVMAAAGVPRADQTWMLREPFEAWLWSSTCAGGDDSLPGTVLVWRSADGAVQHAAVTLGGGWGLHKASQSWSTARKVLTVRDIITDSRQAGVRLHRYTLRARQAAGGTVSV
jgi:hypothetical protein